GAMREKPGLKPFLFKTCFAFVLALALLQVHAQGTYIPLGTDAYYDLQRLDVKYSRILPIEHTCEKPFLRGNAAKIAETLLLSNLHFKKVQASEIQYLIDENPEFLDSLHSRTKRPLFKKLYTEPASFFSVYSKKKDWFDLHINPMIGLSVGGESQDSRFVFTRSVGLEVRGNIKRVFSFYFNVTGNDERPPSYVSDVIHPANLYYLTGQYRYAFVPGQAYWKDYNSKLFKFNDGIDYFDARGYININVLKYMNITFGRDKNFIGDGIRSIFLSDYSAPYLFLKFNLHLWRFNYDNIFAQLNSQYIRGADQLLPKKYMAVHHLTLQATHWLNIGVFETVIFSRSDNFELQYLNPIIFYRAVEHSLGSPDNVMLGADAKANIAGHAQLYAQFLLDEFNFKHFFKRDGWWANKWALQAGFKYIDILPNLDAQLEFNYVRPFTYTHDDGSIDYTNYNQPLGDPLGANFYEFIVNLHYHPLPQLTFNARYFVARVGDDTLVNGVMTNFGGNIFQPNGGGQDVTNQLGNKTGQGAKGTINFFEFLATYQIWHNINFDCSLLYRGKSTLKSDNNPITSQSTFIFSVGVRVNMVRRTYEF
ncbi:MAG TPA: hypothetical protein VG603_00200, partial [Chitinophagales bacterium]|nr:hypothetical protein [Chitinophagales bacterium]